MNAVRCWMCCVVLGDTHNPVVWVAPTTPQDAPPPVDQLWDWFWAAAPTSIRQYRSKLHSDGFDNVRAITLLRPEDFQRYDMPFGHRAQLVHHAKEALGLK